MEIKILCPCGSKYKFDVEPLNGRLPGPVNCPVCGAEGTDAANSIIAAAGHTAAPAPPLQSAQPAATVAHPVRIQSSTSSSHAAAPPIPKSSAEHRPSAPVPLSHPPGNLAAAKARNAAPGTLTGVIGALIGGVVGMLIWYGITVGTMREFGMVAWGVGALTGWCGRLLARGVSPQLGIAAGAVALFAILGGQFLSTRHVIGNVVNEMAADYAVARVAYAKEGVGATNDAAIRRLLAESESENDSPSEAEVSKVTDAEVQEFKSKELPKLRKIAAGEVSKTQLEKEGREALAALDGAALKASFSLWTLLWLVFGVGSAFKIGSGRS